MSRPPKRTSPSTRAPGAVSCMRLRQRSSVDLPQPDGPMIAVTCPGSTANDTSLTIRAAPKNASSDTAAIAALLGSTSTAGCVIAFADSAALAAMLASSASTIGTPTSRSIAAESELGPRRKPGCETDDEDEAEEDDGARPGLR